MASDTSPSGEDDPASSPPQQPGAVTPEASELPKSPDVGTSPELTGAVKPPKSAGAQAPRRLHPQPRARPPPGSPLRWRSCS